MSKESPHITTNLHILQYLVDYINNNELHCALIFLDQEKAFDRVDWQFMLRVLEKMGFGPSFISWVRLFYTGPMASVLVNGFFTEPFSLSRGVRQGCPLSAPLYVLVAETLACQLRANSVLTGLRLPLSDNHSALISQYADDTSIFCTSDMEITTVFDVYRDYELASGAKLNLSKCKGLWCGSWRNRPTLPVALDWTSDNMKCIGIFIGHGNLEELNW